MDKYGIILTENHKAIELLKFESSCAADTAYNQYKGGRMGVVKVKIEKAHEPQILTNKKQT